MKIYGDENLELILKEVGNRMKDIRIRRKMTQQELALKAGVSFSTVVRIEKGESTNLENLMRVMRVFDLLENFDFLIPEQVMTPEELYKGMTRKKRVRKSGVKRNVEIEWIWEDEK